MNKLSNIISGLNYRDLKAIEKDLYEGNIAKLIKIRKKDFEEMHKDKTCPTCGNVVDEINSPFTLTFGPNDFKKKATFCGLDCLNFFLRKMENEVVK